MIILFSIAVIALTTSAQLLLKVGARQAPRSSSLNSYVLIGYALFGFTVVISFFLMQQVEMKYFTALMSMNFIAVAVFSTLLLKEKMGRRRLIGTLLIASGVAIFVLS